MVSLINCHSSPYIANLESYFQETEAQLCTQYFRHTIVVEFPHKTLKKEIDRLMSLDRQDQTAATWVGNRDGFELPREEDLNEFVVRFDFFEFFEPI